MCDHLAEGASILSQLECAGKLDLLENTPQPFMVIFQYNLYILGSIFEPCYVQNRVTTNHVIKRL